MAEKNSVMVSLPDASLTSRDLVIQAGDGTLCISGDSLAWFVQGNDEGEVLTWEEFSLLIQKHGKLCRITDRRM